MGEHSKVELNITGILDEFECIKLITPPTPAEFSIALSNRALDKATLIAVIKACTNTYVTYSQNTVINIKDYNGPPVNIGETEISLQLEGFGYIISYSDFLYNVLGGK